MPEPLSEQLRHVPGNMPPSPGRTASGATRGIWVLGYGSIVEKATCGRTLGYEPVDGADFRLAVLQGALRRWDACMDNIHDDPTDKHYVDGNGKRPDYGICFLGLGDRADASVNGVVVKVSRRGLAAFDRRERRYERVDVTGRVQTEGPIGDNAVVYAYYPSTTARAAFERHRGEGSAVVPGEYLSAVERAFAGIGRHALTDFWASTEPPLPVADLAVIRAGDRV